jgi:hypothetical protein
MGLPGPKGLSTATAGTVGPSSRSRERTPTQNFLELLAEASAPQRIEMALKPQNDREMKGQPYMEAARVQELKCRRDLEPGCSHISGLLSGVR